MSEHTPGPWSVAVDRWWAVVSIGDYKTVASAAGPARGFKEEAANARLIAAAPDMLEALEWIRSMDWNIGELCDRIDTAIAKAKGEVAITGAAGEDAAH